MTSLNLKGESVSIFGFTVKIKFMINNQSSNRQRLWGLVFVNILLLVLAIASDVAWYLLSSIAWSLITIKYYEHIKSNQVEEKSEEAVHE